MKRFKILSILIAVFMLGACSNISKGMNYGDDAGGDHNGEPGGGDVVDDSLWPDEIKQEMIDYFGETLPYVELNETTIYSDYDSDYEESGYGHYYVGDDSEVNALVYSEYFFEGINLTDTWYALLELEESEDGDYYWLGLANENDVSEAFITNLLAAGYYYDEEWECYSHSDDAVEIYISVNDAYTLIEICGPYLGEEPVDLGEETGNVFAKVTSAEQLVDGKYLVVYEEEGMVFNSGLDELDAVENYLEVTITEAGIASTTGLESIALVYDSQAKSLMTADGLYVGHTGSKNTLNTSASPLTNDITFDENGNAKIKSGDYTLQFNNQNGQMRFRYYSSVQQSVQLYLLVEEDL